jgi:hypothetical protein
VNPESRDSGLDASHRPGMTSEPLFLGPVSPSYYQVASVV